MIDDNILKRDSFYPSIKSLDKTGFSTESGILLSTDQQENAFSPQEKELAQVLKHLCADDLLQTPSPTLIKAVLIENNPAVSADLGKLLQMILSNTKNEAEKKKDPKFNLQAQIFIGNIVALLPFFYPEDFASKKITIPRMHNGRWEEITYQIKQSPIEPPSSFWKGLSKVFGQSIDILELEPVPGSSEDIPAIRSLQGTTYPAGKNMALTLLADTLPFASVGELFFLFCRASIQKSITQNTKRKVDIYGASLGASTAMLAGLAFADKVDHVFAYSPPKLLPWTLKRYAAMQSAHTPKVVNFIQEGDLVTKAGCLLPEGTTVIKLSKDDPSKRDYPFNAHKNTYSSLKGVAIKKIDQNNHTGWSAVSIIHLILSPIIFCTVSVVFLAWRLLIACPYELLCHSYHVFSDYRQDIPQHAPTLEDIV